jgi:branched-chain amino acid aminotransferase
MSGKIVKPDLDWGNLPFGYVKTDYNIRFYYKNGKWSEGTLSSDENISLSIAAPCLHYGQEAFEGMKAFETVDGRIVVFRPDENANRMKSSCKRMYMPEFPVDKFIEATKKVVAANARFVPPYGTGASLYIRPVMFGVGPRVGLGPAEEYQFIIFVTPVGPYYKGGFKPVRAIVVEQFDRAAPSGVGDVKVGGNYAAGLRGSEYGHDMGYQVVLYLDPKEKKYIDEFSTSNFIAAKGNSYITPQSESILPSITNKSLSEIAAHIGMTVERRPVTIDEVSSFEEVGAVGTAAVITPVCEIMYRNSPMKFGTSDCAGPKLTKLYENFIRIQTAQEKDIFSWLDEVKL